MGKKLSLEQLTEGLLVSNLRASSFKSNKTSIIFNFFEWKLKFFQVKMEEYLSVPEDSPTYDFWNLSCDQNIISPSSEYLERKSLNLMEYLLIITWDWSITDNSKEYLFKNNHA